MFNADNASLEFKRIFMERTMLAGGSSWRTRIVVGAWYGHDTLILTCEGHTIAEDMPALKGKLTHPPMFEHGVQQESSALRRAIVFADQVRAGAIRTCAEAWGIKHNQVEVK